MLSEDPTSPPEGPISLSEDSKLPARGCYYALTTLQLRELFRCGTFPFPTPVSILEYTVYLLVCYYILVYYIIVLYDVVQIVYIL